MNKKILNTLFILLAIVVIICVVISIINLKNNSNDVFSSKSRNTINSSRRIVTSNRNATDDGIGGDKNFILDLNNNYTIIMVVAIILVILFILFYLFLSRKKEW